MVGFNLNQNIYLFLKRSIVCSVFEQERSMERIVTTPIYHADLIKIKSLQKEKNLKKLADAVRVCIEYSHAHGVFS